MASERKSTAVTRKWPLPMAGSSTLRSSAAAAGVERVEVGDAVGLGAGVALEGGGFGVEGGFALFQQGREGALDDEVDERLGGVEAAAVLAGVAVGADDDFAFRRADGFALEQALVDGAELLDGHVAVVDEAAAGVAPGAAEIVDDGGEHAVGEADLFEHGRGLAGEEAAVVGAGGRWRRRPRRPGGRGW